MCEGGSCQLLGSFGIAVQMFIGVWCFFVLFVLWRCESPRRSLHTWLGDMSKQMIGAFWGHAMNVGMAVFFGERLGPSEANNQCVWYMVGFMSDIIFVTLLCWLVTRWVRPHVRQRCGLDLGDYEDPSIDLEPLALDDDASSVPIRRSHWAIWSLQLTIWLGIMTGVKVVVCYGVYVLQAVGYFWTAVAFDIFGLCGHRRLQLIASVVIVPIIGDTIQFAIQDGFLKKKLRIGDYREGSGKYATISREEAGALLDDSTPSGSAREEDAAE